MKNVKNIKICTVVIGKNLNQFLYNLENIQKISNFVELRVDTIENLKLDDLELIRRKTKKPQFLLVEAKVKEEILLVRKKSVLGS